MQSNDILEYCRFDAAGEELLKMAITKLLRLHTTAFLKWEERLPIWLGVLISVVSTSVVDQVGGYGMWKKEVHQNVIVVFDSIHHVEVEGSSYFWYGALAGTALGVAIGAASVASGQILSGLSNVLEGK